MQAVFLTLVLLALPLYPLVIRVFLTHMIVCNVLGHAGVAPIPARLACGLVGAG